MYMTVKALLERMAPVLIDGMAVSALLGLVDENIKSSVSEEGDAETVIDAEDPVGAGMKLLLVSNNQQQEGLAVASIARDDPSALPGNDPFPRARMHRNHMRSKFGSEFET